MANLQLANNLRRLRKNQNLTQQQVSAKLNISRQAYSNYETGQRDPDLDTLLRIAHIYHVSLEQLLAHSITSETSSSLRDDMVTYTPGITLDTLDTLYLSKEEMELILFYRNAVEEDRRLVRRLLGIPG